MCGRLTSILQRIHSASRAGTRLSVNVGEAVATARSAAHRLAEVSGGG
jgi:hypothetical protein